VLRRGKLLGILITLLCLGAAFYRVDLGGLYGALAAADYVLVVPAALCTLAGYALRTVRWRTILAEAAPTRFVTLFGILMIGFATNNLLPARLGEFARAYLLRRRSGVRKTFLLASIFLERVFDGLVLVAMLAGLSLLLDLPGWGREVELVAGGFFLTVALAVVVLLTQHELVERLLDVALRPFPDRFAAWTCGAFGAFLMGLGTMRRPTVLVRTAALSVAVWSLEWSSYYVLSGAFQLGLSEGQRAVACALMLVVINLGIMLPSSPGYVGTFQVFAVTALAVFGVPREAALALAIVAHLMQYLLVTAIGAAFFGREHVTLRNLSADATRDSDAPPVATGVIS
jgi:uncharacterized protein (TIRG00374 family)